MKTVTLLASLLTIVVGRFSYEGYKVYQVIAKNEEQIATLYKLRGTLRYGFFTDAVAFAYPLDVMVSPTEQEAFLQTLADDGFDYSITTEDVENKISAEHERIINAAPVARGEISFTEFQNYTVILNYLDQLAASYPDIVTVEEFGRSFEDRPLVLIKIGAGSENNPTILIDSTIHAMEWISTSVTTYVIQQLVENSDNRYLIENINWVIIPVLNPDGYEYTFTEERLWRKTRRPGTLCDGVDANRNFLYHWGGNGTSTDECNFYYIGPYPFSEPEVLAFTNVVSQIKNLVIYLSMHSYGSMILFPWGWTTELVSRSDELQQLGDIATKAIAAVNGTEYIAGPSSRLLYYAAGNSVDWVTYTRSALSYTVELPAGPGDGILDGFIVPPERILPICEEFWPGLVSFANHATRADLNNNINSSSKLIIFCQQPMWFCLYMIFTMWIMYK